VRRGSLRDERGAIMLMGVFMAVFLAGTLYYVVGIGEAVWQRERMQDAADAAAFSAAVLHARGMNLIVLINMVMAALLAILVSLKLVETIVIVAEVAIAFASFLSPGLAAAIPALDDLRQSVKSIHDELQPAVDQALVALHQAARGVRAVVPAASELPAIVGVATRYDPPAHFALVLPPRAALPTRDGTFEDLCDKAGEYVGVTTHLVLTHVVVPDKVADIVGGAVNDLVKGGASWFCGADGAEPPSTTVKDTANYPLLPSRVECMERGAADSAESAHKLSAICSQAEQDEADSAPDGAGNCATRCGADGAYEQRDAAARKACAPRQSHDERLHDFTFQERTFTRSYIYKEGEWWIASTPETEEQGARYELREKEPRPCAVPNGVGPDWNVDPHPSANAALVALCSNAQAPSEAGKDGETREVQHTEVTRLFGCSEDIERHFDLGEHAKDRVDSGGADSKKVPQVMEQKVELGEDELQLRALAIGALPEGDHERVLQAATWQPEDQNPTSIWTVARQLGRVSAAQAEYYYAVQSAKADERSSYLWNMRWQARLRRFRMPEKKNDEQTAPPAEAEGFGAGEVSRTFQDSCAKAASSSDANRGGASSCKDVDLSISDLMLH
jgi:hypothetical protein